MVTDRGMKRGRRGRRRQGGSSKTDAAAWANLLSETCVATGAFLIGWRSYGSFALARLPRASPEFLI
ncbi:hypothetical protein INR49_023426 [Caranx melampygus]|nr:hypothetical protein INR49_023426 [Caranx melampygus]